MIAPDCSQMKRAVGVSPDLGISYISKTWSTFVVDITPCRPCRTVRPIAICSGSMPAIEMLPPRSLSAGVRDAALATAKSASMSFIWSIFAAHA